MLNTSLRAAVVVSLASLVSLAACGERTVVMPAAPVHPPGTMTITGVATLDLSPDCADLTMTLSADGARPGAATSSVQASEATVVAALAKIGVSERDLKLSQISLAPVYEPNPTGALLKVHAYRAAITVTATTHDFSKVADIMDAGAEAGATGISSAFRRSDLAEQKAKVRDMALAAAKLKAKQTADALGISVGRIVSVQESAAGAMWNQAYFPQVENNLAVSANSGGALGGTMQPLTLEVMIGYELASST